MPKRRAGRGNIVEKESSESRTLRVDRDAGVSTGILQPGSVESAFLKKVAYPVAIVVVYCSQQVL